MAKKQSVEDSVSLFPFLSILACIIGILVLMIASITLSQIGRDAPAESADAEAARKAAAEAKQRVTQYKAARAAIQLDRKQLKELRQRAERSEAVRSVLQEARAEFKTLQSQAETSSDAQRGPREELAKHQVELERLAAEIATLEQQLKPLQDQQDKLKAELAQAAGAAGGASGARTAQRQRRESERDFCGMLGSQRSAARSAGAGPRPYGPIGGQRRISATLGQGQAERKRHGGIPGSARWCGQLQRGS